MDYGKAFSQYKRSSIETASKLELVIICYEHAILNLMHAKANLENRNIEKKAINIRKTLDIINELQASLNFDKGGKIAKSLDSLYTYLTNRIIIADVQKNFSILDECIHILSELKSAWEGIQTEKEQPASVNNSLDREIPRLSHQVAA